MYLILSICNDYPLDRTIAVCGLGTIGLLLIMFLKDLGFKRVIAIGNKDIQRTKALELGVSDELYCDTRCDNPSSWLANSGLSIDIFFDCVGRNEVVAQAIEFTSPSGIVMLVGNPASDMMLDRNLYWKMLRNQLTLLGTWNSSFTHDDKDDWHYVMNRLSLGAVHPENLISHRYDFEEFIDGFHLMNEKREEYIKVMSCISCKNSR